MAWTFPLTTGSDGEPLNISRWMDNPISFRDKDGNPYSYKELTDDNGAIYAGWIPVSDKKKSDAGTSNAWTVILLLVVALGVIYFMFKK